MAAAPVPAEVERVYAKSQRQQRQRRRQWLRLRQHWRWQQIKCLGSSSENLYQKVNATSPEKLRCEWSLPVLSLFRLCSASAPAAVASVAAVPAWGTRSAPATPLATVTAPLLCRVLLPFPCHLCYRSNTSPLTTFLPFSLLFSASAAHLLLSLATFCPRSHILPFSFTLLSLLPLLLSSLATAPLPCSFFLPQHLILPSRTASVFLSPFPSPLLHSILKLSCFVLHAVVVHLKVTQ